jgi:hypothetical protein
MDPPFRRGHASKIHTRIFFPFNRRHGEWEARHIPPNGLPHSSRGRRPGGALGYYGSAFQVHASKEQKASKQQIMQW